MSANRKVGDSKTKGFHSSSYSSQKIVFSLCFFLFFLFEKREQSNNLFFYIYIFYFILPSVQLQNLVFLAIIHPVLILAWILCVRLRGGITFAAVSLSILFVVALAQKYILGIGGVALESELLLRFLCN